jgi:hypothetical protein
MFSFGKETNMSDQGRSDAEKVDLGKGSHEEQQGGPEPAKEQKGGDEVKTPPIPARPGR